MLLSLGAGPREPCSRPCWDAIMSATWFLSATQPSREIPAASHLMKMVSDISKPAESMTRYLPILGNVSFPLPVNVTLTLLRGMGKFRFVGGAHNDLSTRPFIVMDYSTVRNSRSFPNQDDLFTEMNCCRQKAALGIQVSCATSSPYSRNTYEPELTAIPTVIFV